jgi:dihydroflavonol-4-reductase
VTGARPARQPHAAGALEAEGMELALGRPQRPASVRAATGGVEVVYHIAATYREAGQSGVGLRSRERGGDAARARRRAAAEGVRRVVHCSTGGVHGHVERPPADEDAPLAPGDEYQRTKLLGEQVARRTGRRRVAWRS